MTIEPGIGVGPLRFGSTFDEVISSLGPPTSVEDTEGLRLAEFEYGEIQGAYFNNGILSTLIVVPSRETLLWNTPVYRLPADEIEELLTTHGCAITVIESCHSAVRSQLCAATAGLAFYLMDGHCDDIFLEKL